MVHPDGSHVVKIGVRLARQPSDLREWLADGTAFEAAGADALWLDLSPATELDPLILTAALAAVTYRSLLVTTLPGSDGGSPPRSLALDTIERLCRGRLRILADADADADANPNADADAAARLAEVGTLLGVLTRIPGDPQIRAALDDPDTGGSWVAVPPPESRATWRATRLAAAERGVHGLVVPADPRLLDLLRNPEDLGGRSDLQLAVG